MKKILTFCIFTILLGLVGCSSDDNNDNDSSLVRKAKVTINVYDKQNNEQIEDIGAIVYIFNALNIHDADASWKYLGNGKFHAEKWDREHSYNSKGEIAENGLILELDQLKNEKYFTVVVESTRDLNKEDRSYGITTFEYRIVDHNLVYTFGDQNIKRVGE